MRLADRAARLYAPVVHATAALSLAGWLMAGASPHDAVLIAVAVLIITCPCALALAVPAVQVVAAGALMRRGVLLNSGDALERLPRSTPWCSTRPETPTLLVFGQLNAEASHSTCSRWRRGSHFEPHPLARAVADVLSPDARPFETVAPTSWRRHRGAPSAD